MKPTLISIVEDEYLVAKLIENYLATSSEFKIVNIFSNGIEILDYISRNHVDIILMDINMPLLDGIQTLKKINDKNIDVKVLMISCHIDSTIIQKAIKYGASGFISKSISCDEILNALNTVRNGGCYFCQKSLNSISNKKKDNNKPLFAKNLTNREKEILNLISLGFSNAEIADKLCLSKRTIETHRRNMLHKFGEKNFIGLIKSVMDLNLVNLQDYIDKA